PESRLGWTAAALREGGSQARDTASDVARDISSDALHARNLSPHCCGTCARDRAYGMYVKVERSAAAQSTFGRSAPVSSTGTTPAVSGCHAISRISLRRMAGAKSASVLIGITIVPGPPVTQS